MRAALLVAVTLSIAAPGAWAGQTSDTKSPDLQQQAHPENTPPPSANSGPATATDSAQKPATRRHHKVRQAKGTPAPSSTQSSATN